MNKHIIYLAAGNSRRFGSNKLLHITQGKPLYRHGLDMLMEFCRKHTDCTLLVVSQYEEILHQAEKCGIRAVYSPLSVKGMSYTIRAASSGAGRYTGGGFSDLCCSRPALSVRTYHGETHRMRVLRRGDSFRGLWRQAGESCHVFCGADPGASVPAGR